MDDNQNQQNRCYSGASMILKTMTKGVANVNSKSKSDWSKFARFIINTVIMSVILYVIVNNVIPGDSRFGLDWSFIITGWAYLLLRIMPYSKKHDGEVPIDVSSYKRMFNIS